MLKICYLSDYKENINTIIDWLWSEFGNETNRNYYENIIMHSLKKNSLPLTFIALLDDELIGTIGLWKTASISRQDLSPWIAALYVKKEFRNQYVSKKLENFVLNYCKNVGFSKIFIHTTNYNYYEKKNWIFVDDVVDYYGNYSKIYKKEL